MNVREKLCKPFGGLLKETAIELEEIANDYAIEFAIWIVKNCNHKTLRYLDYKQLLGEFKKEKGL